MDARQQRDVAKQLASFDGLHVVITGEPVPQRSQERARRNCLQRLMLELHGYGVQHLTMEARESELNHRDVRTIATMRHTTLPKGSPFRIQHVHGSQQPLLWSADAVAGACRAARQGRHEPRRILQDRIYEIPLTTDR